jgi:HD-GYP domain-containing protein (c-di-GMP phosphodiesterase class II)
MLGSFVEVMTKAIDERSPYNKNHTYNVAGLCKKFIRYLSGKFSAGHEYYFDMRRDEQLVMAAYLHDIGKIITPLEIMNKPDRLDSDFEPVKLKLQVKFCQLELAYLKNEISKDEYNTAVASLETDSKLIIKSNSAPYLSNTQLKQIKKLETLTYTDDNGNTARILTPENITSLMVQKGTLTDYERKIMQEHVSITGRLLEKMMFNQYYTDVAKWATGHHELLDGTGYPRGLSGNDVSTEVCILTIMDIFDALTAADRPYKKAVSIPKALEILQSMVKEGKLHGELVELFIESKVYEKE